ncbi:MAG: hypothetical protein LC099_09445 [Anaerolineales bacterium]|nr:hypothetical protein [Anaerolineales bacterium]
MTIRPLTLFDLPLVRRYRDDALTLDHIRALTRGHPLGATGLLAYVNPLRHIYSALIDDDAPLLGGIIQTRGEPFAKLLYLAPTSHFDNPQLPALLERLVVRAGKWGAFHVIAETDESGAAFSALRQTGFAVYAWQRVWDASLIQNADSAPKSGWRRAQSFDLPAVRRIHYQIVPQLLHPVDPAPKRPNGFIHADGSCFASVSYGAYGAALTPWILPNESDAAEKISSLIASLPPQHGRPLYINVRSYQAWLEPALEDLGAKASPRQAVMVKYLSRLIKDEAPARAPLSTARAQPTQMSRMDTDE